MLKEGSYIILLKKHNERDCHEIDAQVTWGSPSEKDLLTRIYVHPLFLRRSQIQRSISHSGDEARMQKFVSKVLSGS